MVTHILANARSAVTQEQKEVGRIDANSAKRMKHSTHTLPPNARTKQGPGPEAVDHLKRRPNLPGPIVKTQRANSSKYSACSGYKNLLRPASCNGSSWRGYNNSNATSEARGSEATRNMKSFLIRYNDKLIKRYLCYMEGLRFKMTRNKQWKRRRSNAPAFKVNIEGGGVGGP